MGLERNGKTWSEEEVRQLLDLAGRGLSDLEIGRELGRTEKAVTVKLERLRRGPGVRVRRAVRLNGGEAGRRKLDCMPNPFNRRRDKYNDW
ncbi:MAG TPA: hypothetical protein H9995_04125 [Candidatus Alistipes excrementigallinarum]|nr:hypothetical protein [Candidatus Alistipes excrementigallinarum]